MSALKDELHAAQSVLAAHMPHTTERDTPFAAAMSELATTVAEVEAAELRQLPEPPTSDTQ